MLRLKDRIRLTPAEGSVFKTITREQTAPTTVTQHNRALQKTAKRYHLLAAQENSTDAEFLARIAEGELITTEPESTPGGR